MCVCGLVDRMKSNEFSQIITVVIVIKTLLSYSLDPPISSLFSHIAFLYQLFVLPWYVSFF
jgi:hypothetical protein